METGKHQKANPPVHDHSALQGHAEKIPQGSDMRGAARPMMGMQSADGKGMSMEERQDRMRHHHMQTLWVYWMLVMLGALLVLSPLTFQYDAGIVRPPGGRVLWLSDHDRAAYMKWSDIISGITLIIFGCRSLLPGRQLSIWISCLTGVWLCMAPLIFWAPSPGIYLTDTITGMLAIAATVLIPGMPGMLLYMKPGAEIPEGWSYNPSSWPQRWIMIVLGFLGFVVSRYLAAYQLGYLGHVWDPLFGNSSTQVLTSATSRSLPVSDAGLGTLAYTFEFLMGFMGGVSRWRTMPWMVSFFGLLVIPLGLVHIFLVISQPLTVGAWCFFCLAAAAIMLPMIPLEADEVVAMIQHMRQATRGGERFWPVFWKGGRPAGGSADTRSPELMQLNRRFGNVFRSSLWGMSVPPTLLLSALLGILLLCLPGIAEMDIRASFSNINHLYGSLAVVIAVISMGEVVRPLRLLNIAVGLALAVLPWIHSTASAGLKLTDLAAGLLLVACALPRGRIREQYGWWNKYIK